MDILEPLRISGGLFGIMIIVALSFHTKKDLKKM